MEGGTTGGFVVLAEAAAEADGLTAARGAAVDLEL
jgi:hypothetical protein